MAARRPREDFMANFYGDPLGVPTADSKTDTAFDAMYGGDLNDFLGNLQAGLSVVEGGRGDDRIFVAAPATMASPNSTAARETTTPSATNSATFSTAARGMTV
jgi:hypothetical protein